MKRILFAALAALLFCCISTEMRAQVPAPFGKLRVDKSYALRVYDEADVLMTKDQRSVYWNLEENKAFKTAQILEIPAYTCAVAGGALIGWFGANMIVSNTLSTGSLMSLLTYCMNILMSLMMLSMVFIMITMSEASARRISEVINEKSSLTNPENPIMEVPDGSIRFEDVDFSYRPGSAEPVLKDISLDIRSGESIGIIGGTGSAKSSLVNLVSRLYDVTQGRILVGGHDVAVLVIGKAICLLAGKRARPATHAAIHVCKNVLSHGYSAFLTSQRVSQNTSGVSFSTMKRAERGTPAAS